jgi:4-carboxymuconolactone decarboxylase
MARLPKLTDDEMTAEQRAAREIIGPTRVDGPFALWLRVPLIAERAQGLSEAVRAKGTFEPRLFELITLAATRPWAATYPFEAHARHAETNGVSPEVVDAIRHRRTPPFTRDDERLVFDTVTELTASRTLGQAGYDRALAALGPERLVELITAAGLYTMIAMMAVAFDVDPPAGRARLT